MKSALANDDYCVSPSAVVLNGVICGRSALAVWDRRLNDDLRCAAEAIRVGPAYRHRVMVDAFRADEAVARAMSGLVAPEDALQLLAKDLSHLLRLALSLADGAPIALRLERVDDDGCRLFHVDRVCARMICTYAGEGTEWVRDSAVDRSLIGQGNNAHVRDATTIRRIPTGAIALMRGDLHAAGHGVMHRSPAIAGSLPRVLAAIDW